MSKFIKLLLFIIIITGCFIFPAQAQTNQETEVNLHQKIGSRFWQCYLLKNAVYDEQEFKKISEDKNCSHLKTLNIDFTKQQLIGYRIGGDCFIRGDAKVFRNDQSKTYNVRLKNYWGGCRAGGSFVGWLVIDKIPKDYKVEFTQIRIDDLRFGLIEPNEEKLETRQIDLKGCIQTFFTKSFIIKDEASYLQTIRHDASRDGCLKNLEKIDFSKNSLLGIEINSGYCRIPLGLKYETLKKSETKEYLFKVSYIRPQGLCRAVSRYALWVLVPKIPEGFKVKFDVRAEL